MGFRIRLDRLIPFAVVIFLFNHGKKGFSAKFSKLTTAAPTFQTKQRFQTASGQLKKLLVGDDEDVLAMSESQLLQLIKSSVKIRGSDPSVDAWNTPIRLRKSGMRVQLISAGPDRLFGNADDIMEEFNLGEF